MSLRRTPSPSSTDLVGDAIGIGAAIIGTVAVHLAMFGGDRYFPLRFLLFPLDNVIAFSAFWISAALLVIAIVRATRIRAWAVLSPNGEQPVDTVSPGEVAKRALRVAAIIAALNALFMIVFVIGAVVAFAVIFLIAAALIAGVYIVLKALAPSGG
ncbi:hypothetical protein [Microbacterium phyllosphaerae]|uniref:hypothetical protein n=1 Tax=Microbacterium phyllosphaerae TaxID=124798 RepID=UPI003D658D66